MKLEFWIKIRRQKKEIKDLKQRLINIENEKKLKNYQLEEKIKENIKIINEKEEIKENIF